MKPARLLNEFFENEKVGGLLLVGVTVISLLIANSPLQTGYLNFWHYDVGGHSLTHWINDGLMAIFFLFIGLELKREIYGGELSNIKSASLPLFAALGGLLVPAGIYLLINFGTPTQAGAGIPMATDIAFAIGILSLLGKRVPTSLKVFLTALAIADDLGAILVIALFYTSSVIWLNLLMALGVFALLLVFNQLKWRNLIPYLIGGFAMWYLLLPSGVHATIAGIGLAFAIPFEKGGTKSPSYTLQHFLHKPVTFFILPLFAIANTCIVIGGDWKAGWAQPGSLGIMAGLVVGKPVGIFLFSFLAVSAGLCSLPADLKWKNILGIGLLGGIGFTMSIFITLLAFKDPVVVNNSNLSILLSSAIAGTLGFVFLKLTLKNK
jgi:NhaA family Na+:H+ antiporter